MDGPSLPTLKLFGPSPKKGWDATAAKAGPGTPQESEVTTRLAANLCAELSISSPAEITSNMGAT